MEEAPKTLFERWIEEEVAPKALGLNARELLPEWALGPALQACVKPYFYWAQERASSNAAGTSASRTPQPSSVNPTPGPVASLTSLVQKHPELVLHTGPPGRTLLMPKERLAPDLWEEVHRVAKAAGYAYVPYDPVAGKPGHWVKAVPA